MIHDDSKIFNVTFTSNVSAKIRFKSRIADLRYDIGVYQSRNDSFSILGNAYGGSLNIIDEKLLDEMSIYNRTCSDDCRPGFHKLYIKKMVCCWTCQPCPANTITVESKANHCVSCERDEHSTVNNTCSKVDELYIQFDSPLFVVPAVCSGLCVLAAIALGILVQTNRNRPIIRSSDEEYLYLMLLSLTLGFATCFIPLLKPSARTCSAEYFCLIVVSTMITTNLMWRSVKVYKIFQVDRIANTGSFFLLQLLNLTIGKISINLISLAIVLTFALIDVLVVGPGWVLQRTQERDHGPAYLVCGLGGNEDGMKIVFSTLPFLLPVAAFITSLVLAVKMRKFPFNLRETLSISAATLICFSCYIVCLSAYSFTKDYYKSFLRVLLYFTTNVSFLGCLFSSKAAELLRPGTEIEEERKKFKISISAFASRTSNAMHSKLRKLGRRISNE
jgi:hypothetical protein